MNEGGLTFRGAFVWTIRTTVGFFACVCPQVGLQVVFEAGAITTEWTLERLFTTMAPCMRLHDGLVWCTEVTKFALQMLAAAAASAAVPSSAVAAGGHR